MPAREPFVLSPTEGESFKAGPFDIITRVSGSQSEGAFEMYELGLGVATVDYHVHMKMDETIHIIAGEIEFNVVGKKYQRPPGSVAFIPRGLHHGFANLGPARARVLLVFSPYSRQNEYFRALEKLFAAPSLDMAALAAVQAQYDQQLIKPGT
jgi:uncharacterized cupin superfamily protein